MNAVEACVTTRISRPKHPPPRAPQTPPQKLCHEIVTNRLQTCFAPEAKENGIEIRSALLKSPALVKAASASDVVLAAMLSASGGAVLI